MPRDPSIPSLSSERNRRRSIGAGDTGLESTRADSKSIRYQLSPLQRNVARVQVGMAYSGAEKRVQRFVPAAPSHRPSSNRPVGQRFGIGNPALTDLMLSEGRRIRLNPATPIASQWPASGSGNRQTDLEKLLEHAIFTAANDCARSP